MSHAWLIKFQGANDFQCYLLPLQGELFFTGSLILPGLYLLMTLIVVFVVALYLILFWFIVFK